ncbi:Type II/IV secretion system secretin RcpA/CpaC, associated with Flp pilus assembly [hydrothermal vent metagenome]|uniref:Type II/IV secretion system secretin RcpA/CpaC, associated with Flp pilus assembly n=1 Tax=hydrothermal vent metagenome TaxID=652676 RepID=A0A3B0T1R8_9ZZZZ
MCKIVETKAQLCGFLSRASLALAVSLAALAGGLFVAPANAQTEFSRTVNVAGSKKAAVRRITIGLNKSVIVRLPRPTRDVLVSNPEIVDAVVRTPETTFLIARAIGETNVFYFDASGRQILTLEINVARDVTDLSNMIRKLIPSSRIKIEALGDNIILTGSARNTIDADRAGEIATKFLNDVTGTKVVNMIAAEGKDQVLLKVTIAEMQRTLLKQLGVDLAAAVNIASTVVNLTSVNPFTIAGQALSTSNLTAAGNWTAGNGGNVNAVLRALERNGLLRTLAEPNLTSVSGETANFLAGGEFPVPVGINSSGQVTIEFKPYGVGLAFTPVVLDEGRISLKVSTEVSELTTEGAFTLGAGTQNGITIPALKVRRANTTVELPSGGSLVLAGLMHESSKQDLNGFPGLKTLPVLGSLFRSRDFQKNETELVVIATPYVVNPTSRAALARPDEGFMQPSDKEVTFLGRLNAVYGMRTGQQPQGQYHGDFGFIVK